MILRRWTSVPDPYAESRIEIGRHTYGVGPFTVLFYRPDDRVKIGSFCSIATGVRIMPSGGHFFDRVSTFPFRSALLERPDGAMHDVPEKGGIVIGHDVWIGTNAMILAGARVGNGAVIAAGAVVRGEVPPYAIVGGVPAKVIRYRFDEERRKILNDIAWWEWPDEQIRDRVDEFYGDVDAFIARWRR